MNRQVFQLVMAPQAVAHRLARVVAEGAATHHVGAAQARAEGLQAQVVDHRQGLFQASRGAGIAVHGGDLGGTGGELDLRHAAVGAPQAVAQVVGDRVIEHRRAIAAQLHGPALAFRVEAVAQQRQHHMGMRQFGHAPGILVAVPA
ncbi:hypothetical protein D3C81_1221910 [compost metagenome]